MNPKINESYDAIIVGCGIAGSIVGALLSHYEKKKVLVLEQASGVGGRAISFRGEGIKDAVKFRSTLSLAANAWVHRSEPDLLEIFDKRLLDGYVLEAGGRAGWYTNRGRVSFLLAAFNKPSIFYPNVGLVWYDHNWSPHIAERGVQYGWMSKEGYAETQKISKRMLQTPSITDAEKYDRISLKDWLNQFTSNPEALEFHYAIGTWHTILNDPGLISAGENLKAVIISREEKVHFTKGAWSLAGSPGHRFITEGFCDVIAENNGQVVNNATVKEVCISNGKATGVIANISGEEIKITSPTVVCTLPPRTLLKLLPENVLPEDLRRAMERTINTAMVSWQFGLRKPLEAFSKVKIDPKSFLHAPVLISEEEGLFRGNVPLDGFTLSNCAPTVAPEGKYLAVICSSILDNEAKDRNKVNIVTDRMLKFMDNTFPGYKQELDWMLSTVSHTALCWRYPEDEKPDVTCPNIEGLYFAGDAYGKRCNEGGIEAASHSGVVCAEAITGNDYLKILPSHLQ